MIGGVHQVWIRAVREWSSMKTINLVLSGGAAKGLAHIGVISVLEERYRIKSIIGTSMGAVVGGLYAYGYNTKEIREIAGNLNSVESLKFFRLDIIRKGLVRSDNILEYLKEITRGARIENLKIPFAAIAYDMKHRSSVTFEKGGLAEAMLASSSVPLFFEPFSHNGYIFYDGGLEYPLPIEFHDIYGRADLTVAVSCTPQLPGKPRKYKPLSEKAESDKEAIELAMDALDINQTFLTMRSLERVKPDIYIPDHDEDLSVWDFDRVDDFIALGRKSAEEALDAFDKDKDILGRFLKRSQDVLEDIAKIFS